MKVKFLWMYLVALVGVLGFTSCSDDDDSAPAVGITSITVTPEGSAVGYSATFTGFNATVGIPADVYSLETLTNATVEATATMGKKYSTTAKL